MIAMRALGAAILFITAGGSAFASTILVGATSNSSGGVFVGNQANLYVDSSTGIAGSSYGNLAWAQAFSLSKTSTVDQLSVDVNDNNVANSTFNVFLTDKIGLGASSSNVLFSGSGPFGPGNNTVNLTLPGTTLVAGTYYVVMTSDTPVPIPALDGSDCGGLPLPGELYGCYFTGGWSANGNKVGSAGSLGQLYVAITGFQYNSPGPAIDVFDLGNGGTGYVNFTLSGNVVPEPSTTALMVGAFAGLGFLVRRRRQ